MKPSLKIFLTLFPALLTASVNEPIRWEWRTGYRNDNLHWHLQSEAANSPLTYSEHYRNLQFWENTLAIKAIHRDVAFYLGGSAAFGWGPLKQRLGQLSFTQEELVLPFPSAKAWAADGMTYLGYSVNLTADRLYKVILIPLIGYSVDYEQIRGRGERVASGPSFSLTSSFPAAERICWYGFLFGGLFLIEPGNGFRCEAGYAYHLPRINFRTSWQIEAAGSVATNELVAKEGGNLGHTGWLRLEWDCSRTWRLGVFAEMQYFATKFINVKIKNTAAGMVADQTFKARWTPISGAASLSRVF